MKATLFSLALVAVTALTACSTTGSTYYTNSKGSPMTAMREHRDDVAADTGTGTYHTVDKGQPTGHMGRLKSDRQEP